MTSPERLTDEQVAWRCAYAGGADPVLSDMAILALEVQASRRLAPVHAAAVEIAELLAHPEARYTAPKGTRQAVLAYRAARASAQPEREDDAERAMSLNVAASNLGGRFGDKQAEAIREYVAAALRERA